MDSRNDSTAPTNVGNRAASPLHWIGSVLHGPATPALVLAGCLTAIVFGATKVALAFALLGIFGWLRQRREYGSVTELQRAEEARHQSEERLRELAETIQEVFWVMTPDFKL